jgi:transcriptional regulator of acetoin/glycerol metabolism
MFFIRRSLSACSPHSALALFSALSFGCASPADEEMVQALRTTGGNVARAAGMLGIKRQTAYRICEKAQIKPDDYRL